METFPAGRQRVPASCRPVMAASRSVTRQTSPHTPPAADAMLRTASARRPGPHLAEFTPLPPEAGPSEAGESARTPTPLSETPPAFGAKTPLREAGGGAGGAGLCGTAAADWPARRDGGARGVRSGANRAEGAEAAAAGMDLAVAAGDAGAAQQHQQLRDEVAEKCQKLFQDFLEE